MMIGRLRTGKRIGRFREIDLRAVKPLQEEEEKRPAMEAAAAAAALVQQLKQQSDAKVEELKMANRTPQFTDSDDIIPSQQHEPIHKPNNGDNQQRQHEWLPQLKVPIDGNGGAFHNGNSNSNMMNVEHKRSATHATMDDSLSLARHKREWIHHQQPIGTVGQPHSNRPPSAIHPNSNGNHNKNDSRYTFTREQLQEKSSIPQSPLHNDPIQTPPNTSQGAPSAAIAGSEWKFKKRRARPVTPEVEDWPQKNRIQNGPAASARTRAGTTSTTGISSTSRGTAVPIPLSSASSSTTKMYHSVSARRLPTTAKGEIDLKATSIQTTRERERQEAMATLAARRDAAAATSATSSSTRSSTKQPNGASFSSTASKRKDNSDIDDDNRNNYSPSPPPSYHPQAQYTYQHQPQQSFAAPFGYQYQQQAPQQFFAPPPQQQMMMMPIPIYAPPFGFGGQQSMMYPPYIMPRLPLPPQQQQQQSMPPQPSSSSRHRNSDRRYEDRSSSRHRPSSSSFQHVGTPQTE
jgi:hypothetical protein